MTDGEKPDFQEAQDPDIVIPVGRAFVETIKLLPMFESDGSYWGERTIITQRWIPLGKSAEDEKYEGTDL